MTVHWRRGCAWHAHAAAQDVEAAGHARLQVEVALEERRKRRRHANGRNAWRVAERAAGQPSRPEQVEVDRSMLGPDVDAKVDGVRSGGCVGLALGRDARPLLRRGREGWSGRGARLRRRPRSDLLRLVGLRRKLRLHEVSAEQCFLQRVVEKRRRKTDFVCPGICLLHAHLEGVSGDRNRMRVAGTQELYPLAGEAPSFKISALLLGAQSPTPRSPTSVELLVPLAPAVLTGAEVHLLLQLFHTETGPVLEVVQVLNPIQAASQCVPHGLLHELELVQAGGFEAPLSPGAVEVLPRLTRWKASVAYAGREVNVVRTFAFYDGQRSPSRLVAALAQRLRGFVALQPEADAHG
mmetsp:Transcript_28824/g.73054  ORF Transcript_28824/g.73054 Transcript_28824/m.73054 type:complete len:352 (+) Transcript_28824:1524-2579(+)